MTVAKHAEHAECQNMLLDPRKWRKVISTIWGLRPVHELSEHKRTARPNAHFGHFHIARVGSNCSTTKPTMLTAQDEFVATAICCFQDGEMDLFPEPTHKERHFQSCVLAQYSSIRAPKGQTTFRKLTRRSTFFAATHLPASNYRSVPVLTDKHVV